MLDTCVRRMPAAWLDPSHTCARIRFGEQTFVSANFRETEWKLEAVIQMPNADSSLIEVFYFGEANWDGESPFLDEERALIQSISIQIGQSLKNRRAEIAIQHTNRALATLSAVNRSLTRATDEGELLHVVCKSIVEQGGYRMAWVGYKQHDENKSIKAVASAGYDEGYLDIINITWAESERGMGPTGRAIRSGTTQLCQDFASDPRHLPWRAAALERGYASSIALPLANGEVFGVLTVYAGEINTFTPTEIERLEEMAGDLAFGVRALHIRRERDFAMEQSQQHLAQLRKSLEDTVQAIATIVEMRDPYTAGHQARVASLAAAIAGQMGLPDDRVHGIHLAGIVHDLGKIQTPAEILSKPGRISELEYSLIKIHPHAGYEILKDIDFPWPIALMVLQHHERLDGSGYPLGLKGGEIMLEARILSVADVVEAISAHRPYRPGFGIDVALDEITKQRGIQFDPQVVDACLTLFRERDFHFK
jgi:HD-GYP domain-containing protein (c-di-GMP phosphodiesterase class II)